MARAPKGIPVRERLTAAREARGLDRTAAARDSGVPLRYLGMLEDGEFPLVSDPAYLSPYLRRYAAFLGLAAEQSVIDFLAENEAAERVAAASVAVPSLPDREPESRRKPILVAAMVVAVVIGAGVALVDAASARRWLDWARPTLSTAGGSLQRAAGSVFDAVGASTTGIRTWLSSSAAERVPDLVASAPEAVAPPGGIPAIAAEPPLPESAALAPTVEAPAPAPTRAVVPPTPPPAATVPPATTPIQLSAVARPAAVPAAPTERPAVRGPQRLELMATARQVFVWVSIDGGEQREVELRRGETASFEARREMMVTLDDAGGVTATLNGRRLPPLGAAGYGRRNIRIPGS